MYTHIQLDKALSDYDECIQLDPTFAEAYNKRAEIRQIKGQLYYVKLCYIRYIALYNICYIILYSIYYVVILILKLLITTTANNNVYII